MEAEIDRMRRADPNDLFDLMAKLIAGGYPKRFGNKWPRSARSVSLF
jgi:hypothetical protein